MNEEIKKKGREKVTKENYVKCQCLTIKKNILLLS